MKLSFLISMRFILIVFLTSQAINCIGQVEPVMVICRTDQKLVVAESSNLFNHNSSNNQNPKIENFANTQDNSLFNIWDTSLWPARWNCGVWTSEHGWLYIGSDLAIWLAYFAIPFILGFFYLRRRSEIPFKTVFILFIGFIIACGLTHLIDALIFWWPAYKLSAMLRFGTALVSWATVFSLIKVVPVAMELKGPNSMQRIIDEKIAELTDLNKALTEEVEKRTKAEEKLARVNESLEDTINKRTIELKSINEELNAFSYSISHDLRAPLRSISGFSQALKEDCYDTLDDKSRNYFDRIINAALRMGNLIDDLLNLSRISRMEIKREHINLSEEAKNIISSYDNISHYTFKINKKLVAKGDIKLVIIVLENLIGNAIKYSSKVNKPVIEIGEEMIDNKERAFFIKDNGAGFDTEYADRLFGAFQRLHTSDEFEGLGIGLATVKRIINKHGGEIWAKSLVDQGATFYFKLN